MVRPWARGGMIWLAAAPARAQLWDTGPWDTLDARASDEPDPPSRPPTRAADDLLLPPGSGLAYRISGISGRALARHYSGARIEVYADQTGVPAAVPSFAFAADAPQVLQTGVFGQYDLLDIHAATPGLRLAPGRWWVSVVCLVSGDPAPDDGYGYFGTAGNRSVQGLQARYRVDSGPWLPISQALGFESDLSFTVLGSQPSCYANCDQSTAAPLLNLADFVCFENRLAQGDSYANCDPSTTPPVLNILDFLCFQQRFSAGCG